MIGTGRAGSQAGSQAAKMVARAARARLGRQTPCLSECHLVFERSFMAFQRTVEPSTKTIWLLNGDMVLACGPFNFHMALTNAMCAGLIIRQV